MNLEELIKRCRNHDEGAVTELINQTKSSGFFVARMITGNDADAEEVLQNAYIKIFKNLGELKDDKKFIPWMKSVVEHEAYNYNNSAFKRHTVLFSEMQKDEKQSFSEWKDEKETYRPDKVLDKKTKSDILFEIMDSLPAEQRKTIYLYYFKHLNTSEIAQLMGCQVSTVKSRLKYAREEIKKQVLAFEKKEGIRLHTLFPFPYFLYLIHAAQLQEAISASAPVGITAMKIKEAIDSCTTVVSLPEVITYSSPVISTAVKAGVVIALGTAGVSGVAIARQQQTPTPVHTTTVVNSEETPVPKVVETKEEKEQVKQNEEIVEAIEEKRPEEIAQVIEQPEQDNTVVRPVVPEHEESTPATEQRPSDTMHDWEETEDKVEEGTLVEEDKPIDKFHPSQSEQEKAEQISSDDAGQTGMHSPSPTTPSTETETNPSASQPPAQETTPPEIVEVKPVETPEIVEVKPVEVPPKNEVITPEEVPQPTVIPDESDDALDYSGATQEGSLTESDSCPAGFFWDGTTCVYN